MGLLMTMARIAMRLLPYAGAVGVGTMIGGDDGDDAGGVGGYPRRRRRRRRHLTDAAKADLMFISSAIGRQACVVALGYYLK